MKLAKQEKRLFTIFKRLKKELLKFCKTEKLPPMTVGYKIMKHIVNDQVLPMLDQKSNVKIKIARYKDSEIESIEIFIGRRDFEFDLKGNFLGSGTSI